MTCRHIKYVHPSYAAQHAHRHTDTHLTCTYLIQTQRDRKTHTHTDRQTHLHFGSEQILHCSLSVVEEASEGVSFSLYLLNLMAQHIKTLFDAKRVHSPPPTPRPLGLWAVEQVVGWGSEVVVRR